MLQDLALLDNCIGGVVAEGEGESHHVPMEQTVSERGGSEAIVALSLAGVNVGAVAPRAEDNHGDSGVWDMVLTRA